MVKINYCPKCAKASRDHIANRVICRICKTQFEVINISRSRYFVVQFFFLFLGFAFLIGSGIFLIGPRMQIFKFLGFAVLGIAMWLFTLVFQMMDSKDMEFRAEQRASMQLEDELDETITRTAKKTKRAKAFGTSRPNDDDTGDKPRAVKRRFGEKTGERRRHFGASRVPPPQVVRIRRVNQKPGSEEREPVKKQAGKSKSPEPAVIKDMSQLLMESEED